MAERRFALGLDFGTESARALVADVRTGEEVGGAVMEYPHGVIDERLPGLDVELEPEWALQDPDDYLAVLREIVPASLKEAGVSPEQIVGVGVDFTSCTVMPTDESGRPLCTYDDLRREPNAWPKLWKHHAAAPEAEEITAKAQERGERFLDRYGGKISSEWLFPKALQVLRESPHVYDRAAKFIEGGDWLVMQLTGQERRSACQAGYKAMWDREDGYPSREFLAAVDPRFVDMVDRKIPPDVYPIGACAGEVTDRGTELTGLLRGTPVAVAVIDAHVAAPAAGVVRPGQMLMIMGTSLCHMALHEQKLAVKGVAGIVADGIIPGFYGYEAGQAAVGDIFVWFTRSGVPAGYEREASEQGKTVYALLEERAALLKPGQCGLIALDWWNGNRSILMDASLSGLLLGCTLDTRPEDIYRALIEATAFGTRVIIENMEIQGISARELYACGGLAEKNALLMQIYADVLGREIRVARSSQTCALGAAMWGAVAAGAERGGYATIQEAAEKMAGVREAAYVPRSDAHEVYNELYAEYVRLHDYFGRGANDVMRRLRELRRWVSGGK
ncbi:MAG: ribulokinase [Armatimonadota bacterium]